VTPRKALLQLGLTGTGTRDGLTVTLDRGQELTLTRDDVKTWPDGQPLTSSVVLVGSVPFELRYAVDLMQRARHYFELVHHGTVKL
jgi:hypothetical protein